MVGFTSFRGWFSLTAVLAVGAGALMIPWLSVRGSLRDGYGPADAADAPTTTGIRVKAADGTPRGRLLLFPVPAAPQPRLVSSAPTLAAPAPDPAAVLALEQRLRRLSYMVGPEDGILDAGTRSGLMAFQKVENLARTGEPDAATLGRVDVAQPPAPAYSTPADHLEVDVARQVVFVVRGGRITETLPTSTGNGKLFRSEGRTRRAVTPNGQFAITYKRNGWRRSPLGLLYRPAYFNGGIAFHGAKSVPASPASHGCVRLPMVFADWFADSASPPGMVVYVYGNPGAPHPAPVVSPPASLPPGGPAGPLPPPEGGPVPAPAAPPLDDTRPLLGGILPGG